MTSSLVTPPWRRRFTFLTAAATLFLIFAGAMVTSTGSGLAVPDWPLSYGMLMPPMVGGIFYEHGHRMIATLVGFLTLVQAVWLQLREPKRFARRLGWLALVAVVIQGLFGGLTVLLLLPPALSVVHAALAGIFFCIVVSIAFFCSSTSLRLSRLGPSAVDTSTASALVLLVIFAQILIGAIMRHLGAGLAIPDFPLSHGRLVPEFVSLAVTINYAHRIGAVVALLAIVAAAPGAWRSRSAAHRLVYSFLVVLMLFQVTLGAMTVWSLKQPVVTSLHVMTGSAMLAVALLYALISRVRSGRRDRVEMALPRSEAVA